MSKRIGYLCLQATREGQASYAHVHEIIAGLRQEGYDVVLYEPAYVSWERAPGPLRRLVEFTRTQLRLWRKGRGLDVIYIRSHPLTMPTAIWARRRGIPTIQEVNGPFEDLWLSHAWTRYIVWLLAPMSRVGWRRAGAVIANTNELRMWLLGQVRRKRIEVIPNGANTELFRPDATTDLDLPKPYVAFFGALSRWQGVDTMIEAVEQPEWPDVSLVVAGDGHDRAKVEAAAARNPRIRYIGRLPYRQVPGLVAGSIAGLSPKNSLGDRSATGLSPVKAYETLASGVPLIASDLPGQAEIVRQYEAGLVIPTDDSVALARAVRHLLEHPDEARQMGLRGRRAIVEEHSWRRRAADTARLIEDLLANRSPKEEA